MIKKIKKFLFPIRHTLKVFWITKILKDKLFIIRQQFKADDYKFDLRCKYPLTENSVVFDFGGYKGEWAQRIWDKYYCNIYIFEPIKEFLDEAKEKFKGNKKIKFFNYGLSDKDEEQLISIDGVASSTFMGKRDTKIFLKDVKKVIEDLNIDRINLLKINIEGGEYVVLPSMIESELIKKCDDIQIEFHHFYPNAEKLRKDIQTDLSKTHHLTYDYPFFFENWKINQNK
ncbi:MAG: FkbM family methyltransferase [Minisyncoccia bacterium]